MKRTVALGAAWTASAAAAVGLGFLAVSLVDASASPGTQPVAATTTSSTASGSPTGAPVSPSATGQFDTAGGNIVADCTNGSPVLAGVPAAGWSVDDSQDAGKIEFRDGSQRVEVRVTCVGGSPVFSLDDSSSSPAAVTPASGSDDSTGRAGGGHGADDGAADDSSGRGGGGHGSDG
jgi:hypothetical protein